jgi:bacterial/archaeal transporter family protein
MEWLIWALLSALFAGVTALFAKIGVTGINSNLATAIRTSVILFFSWLIAALTTKGAEFGSIGKQTWIFLILSGISTGLSWLCYFRALQVGEVSKVAPIDKLSVVVAMALAILFLREKIDAREGFGAVLIISGALLLAWK